MAPTVQPPTRIVPELMPELVPVSVSVRPVAEPDRAALADFLAALSPQSAYLRFFGAEWRPTPRVLDLLLRRDADHCAAVATAGGCIVGHAMLVRVPARRDDRTALAAVRRPAELAVVVADDWQHRGVGPRLISALIEQAASIAAGGLEFSILATNLHANGLAQRLWPLATASVEHGVVTYRAEAVSLVGTQSRSTLVSARVA